MPKNYIFSYTQLEQAFNGNLKDCFSSEVHGYLCGIICGNKKAKNPEQFKLLLHRLEEEGILVESYKQILAQWVVETFRQFQDQNYSFQLILPEDEKPLRFRIKALSRWCQGFLSGLGDVGFTQEDINQKKLQEVLKDIFSMTGTYYGSSQSGAETDEFSYIELVEHIRMSAILIYTENILVK